MSIGTYLHNFIAETKAASIKVAAFFTKAAKMIDGVAPTIEAITEMIDPQAAQAERAIVALIDEAAAVIQNTAQHNADGSVTVNLTPATVQQVKKVIDDGKQWLAGAGGKP